jgi:hypothetical protein
MMVTELKSKLKLDCLQLKLSKKRPDLTKLDSFLGVLSAEGSFFENGTESKLSLSLALSR